MTSSFKGLTINDTGNITLPNGTSANRPSLQSNTAIQWTNTGSQSYTVLAGSGGTVSNSSWTAPTGVTSIEVLVVAGGGQGGSSHGGGGGAGGLIYNSAFPVVPGTAYAVTVGAGGYAAVASPSVNGSNSSFGTITAVGGGAGQNEATAGNSGGSGAGGAGKGGAVFNGGAGIAGQGHPGGRGTDNNPYNGGGGGGAGKPGQAAGINAGNGGDGLQFSISGSPTYYAGGGGGNAYGPTGGAVGLGGLGGGGIGGIYQTGSTTSGTAGTASTGGGGGGNTLATSPYGMAGGSGIVIIRYTLATATTQPTGQTRFNTATGAIEEFSNTRWIAQSTGDSIATNGLLVHLDASKYGSGTTWHDLTGNGTNGTLLNGATLTTMYPGPELFIGNGASYQDTAATTGLIVGYGSATVSNVVAENGVTPVNGTNQIKISGSNNGERIDYAFSVTAGKNYEVSFYANKYQGQYYLLAYVATSNSGDNLGNVINVEGATAITTASWTQYRLKFTATSTGIYYLSWRMATGSSPSVITYIDQVRINEISNSSNAPAIVCNGNNSYVDLGTTSYALGIRRRATYASWAMVLGTGAFNIPSDYGDIPAAAGMTLRIFPNTMTFYVYPNNYRINVTQTIVPGVWYHVVAVMDNTMLYLYLNGQLVGSTALGGDIASATSATLKIGPRGDGDATAGGVGPLGAIGALQIYNRALTEAEIRINYNAQADKYGKTPLVDFDDNKWKTVNLSEAQRPINWAFTSGYGNHTVNSTSGYLYMGNTSSGNNAANWGAYVFDNNILGSTSYAPGWRSWDATYRLGYRWGWSTFNLTTAPTVSGLAGNGQTTASTQGTASQGTGYLGIMNNSSNNLVYIYYVWWNGTASADTVVLNSSPGYGETAIWQTTLTEGVVTVYVNGAKIGRWDLTNNKLYANTPVTKDTRWLYYQSNQSDCFTEIRTLKVR